MALRAAAARRASGSQLRPENPEDWPNVINRTWVDVRRHAVNVKHRWTAEEVELQMRLWEIQLEKSTDRPKPQRAP